MKKYTHFYRYFIHIFIDIFGADLADMQVTSKFNKGICSLLCVINIFSEHTWVPSIKDKKGIKIDNAFQSFLNQATNQTKYRQIKIVNFTIDQQVMVAG